PPRGRASSDRAAPPPAGFRSLLFLLLHLELNGLRRQRDARLGGGADHAGNVEHVEQQQEVRHGGDHRGDSEDGGEAHGQPTFANGWHPETSMSAPFHDSRISIRTCPSLDTSCNRKSSPRCTST